MVLAYGIAKSSPTVPVNPLSDPFAAKDLFGVQFTGLCIKQLMSKAFFVKLAESNYLYPPKTQTVLMHRVFYLPLICSCLFVGQSLAQNTLMESARDTNSTGLEGENSQLSLPIHLPKGAVEKMLNEQMGLVVYEEDIPEEGYHMKATRTEDIVIDLEGNRLLYKVPLALEIRQEYMLAEVETTGELTLHFATEYDISRKWKLRTQTSILRHEWVKKPRAKMGVLNMPVQGIANMVLKRSKEELCQAIDQQIEASVDLPAMVDSIWQSMQQPLLLSEEYHSWLLLQPQKLQLSPIEMVDDTLHTAFLLQAKPRVYLGEPPEIHNTTTLPPFSYSPAEQGFQLLIRTDIPFEEAQSMANENLQGYTYEEGRKKITVDSVYLSGQGNKLLVELDLSGSYKGKIQLTGKPEISPDSTQITFDKLDYKLETRNLLLKGAGWLLKGPIKKQIRKSIEYYMDYYLDYFKSSLQEEFAQMDLGQGFVAKGRLPYLQIKSAAITTRGIRLWIDMRGQMEVFLSEQTDKQ